MKYLPDLAYVYNKYQNVKLTILSFQSPSKLLVALILTIVGSENTTLSIQEMPFQMIIMIKDIRRYQRGRQKVGRQTRP